MIKIKEKDKFIKELQIYISQVITETLLDHDFGLELKENVKNKLKEITKGKVKFYSEDEIKKRSKL